MVHIVKLAEPHALLQLKKEGLSDYSEITKPVKDAIKAQLFREQKGLCSYCMRRLHEDTMQIEHYIPQHALDGTVNAEKSIDYNNMLGVCPGGKGFAIHGIKDLTCDQHRNNILLTVNPLDPQSIKKIRYKADGTIFSEDSNINYDLDVVLNLNCVSAKLKVNRKAAMDAFQKAINSRYKGKTITKQEWQKLRTHYQEGDRQGLRQEYAGMFIAFIDRKLMAARS